MEKITPQIKAIADAHIHARMTDAFDNPVVLTHKEVIDALLDGKTLEMVMHQVEVRFCTITSTLMARQLHHMTDTYKRAVYKGFKTLLLKHKKQTTPRGGAV